MSTSQPAFDTQQESTLLEEAGVVVDHAKAIVVAIRNAQMNLVTTSRLSGDLSLIKATITQLETLIEQFEENLKSYADANAANDRTFTLQEIAKAKDKLDSRLDKLSAKLDKFGIALAEFRTELAEQRAADKKEHADQRAADKKEHAEERAADKKERAEERAQDKRDRRNALYQMVTVGVAILAGIFYIIRILNA